MTNGAPRPRRIPPAVICSADGRDVDWALATRQGNLKIVIGDPPTRTLAPGLGAPDAPTKGQGVPAPVMLGQNRPTAFATTLTHLHLWGIADLDRLPNLPAGLRCLDVRNCPKLEKLPALPLTLETLVIESCTNLSLATLDLMQAEGGLEQTDTGSATQAKLACLTDLCARGCPGLEQGWLDAVIAESPNLARLDASLCRGLKSLKNWPPLLEDGRFDHSPEFCSLPVVGEGSDVLAEWPTPLRRIGLRGTGVNRVPEFRPALDYIDLAFTRCLAELPQGWTKEVNTRGSPKTLFLYGSGLRKPPRVVQGRDGQSNVAEAVRRYFEDATLTGIGEVKRCKLLMLGNGGAGKTTLSLALIPDQDPRLAKHLGPTHGIQFWRLPFDAPGEAKRHSLDLHIWDCGGQEIYHGTHRLFIGAGTVFIVVWKPDQDDGAPAAPAGGHRDICHAPDYWIRLIRSAVGVREPRIAIVRSHEANERPEDKRKLDEHLKSLDPAFQCTPHFIDSLNREGQIDDLRHWLRTEVAKEIEEGGVQIPLYWQVAQEMVEEWLALMLRDDAFRASHNQMRPETFRQALIRRIEDQVANGADQRCTNMSDSIRCGAFRITDDRLRRTLKFLSDSGWIYWTEELFQSRLIVGQTWALDGIYAILQPSGAARRMGQAGGDGADMFTELRGKSGRFARSRLGEIVWNGMGFSENEQHLLLSFMQNCALCFPLRTKNGDEPEYVCIEHLPSSLERGPLANEVNQQRETWEVKWSANVSPGEVRQRWHALLSHIGTRFGTDATYLTDDIRCTVNGCRILISRSNDPSTLGASFAIRVDRNPAPPSVDEFVKGINGIASGTGLR